MGFAEAVFRVTVFVPIPTHAPISAHQRHFQFKICTQQDYYGMARDLARI